MPVRIPRCPSHSPAADHSSDASLRWIEGQEPVARPRERLETLELARAFALPAEGTPVGAVQSEDPDLAVSGVGHVDLVVRPKRHAGHSAELVGRPGVGQGLRSDRNDQVKARWRRRDCVRDGGDALVAHHEIGGGRITPWEQAAASTAVSVKTGWSGIRRIGGSLVNQLYRQAGRGCLRSTPYSFVYATFGTAKFRAGSKWLSHAP